MFIGALLLDEDGVAVMGEAAVEAIKKARKLAELLL